MWWKACAGEAVNLGLIKDVSQYLGTKNVMTYYASAPYPNTYPSKQAALNAYNGISNDYAKSVVAEGAFQASWGGTPWK